jgi:hypothetical protein
LVSLPLHSRRAGSLNEKNKTRLPESQLFLRFRQTLTVLKREITQPSAGCQFISLRLFAHCVKEMGLGKKNQGLANFFRKEFLESRFIDKNQEILHDFEFLAAENRISRGRLFSLGTIITPDFSPEGKESSLKLTRLLAHFFHY